MSCSQYQKLMYLFRQGELSDWEQRKLQKHLQNCVECSNEFENIQSDWKTIYSIKQNILNPEADVVIREIIQKIEHENKLNRIPKKPFNILDYIPIPQLRFVLTALVIFIIGGLVMQEAFVWNRINNLEHRMATASTGIQKKSRARLTNVFDGMVDEQNNQITISRTEFENLLKSYSDVVLINKLLLDALREAVPELDERFYENGIDKKEMEKLLNNRQQIISRLREL